MSTIYTPIKANFTGSSADHIDIEEWQKRVYGDPGQFLELCRRYSLCPDVWSLYEWCNWLTPDGMGPKRFDTIFYLCLLDHVPTVHIDGQEITQVRVLYEFAIIFQN